MMVAGRHGHLHTPARHHTGETDSRKGQRGKNGTGPERHSSSPETGGGPDPTGSVVPVGFLESRDLTFR